MKIFRPTFIAAALVAIPLLSNGADYQPANLLANSGFEERKANQKVADWSTKRHAGKAAYKFDLDTDIVFKGKQSYRIEQYADQAYGALKQKVVLPDNKGKKFTFTAMLKTKDVTARRGWRLVVNCVGESGRILEQYQSEPMTGTTDWQKVTLEEDIPTGTLKLDSGVMLQSLGTGWVDDAYLGVK